MNLLTLANSKVFEYKKMISYLIFIEYGVIKSRKVKELMTETDRKHYCTNKPYVDAPQSIGNGVTISAPHMVCLNSFRIFFYFICVKLIFLW